LPASVYEQFAAAAQHSPDLAFLCYPSSANAGEAAQGRQYLYGEALKTVNALAQRYQAAGYRRGHRVALVVGNRPEHFWHLLALNSVGASAVLINPGYLPDELAYTIGFADCALAVGHGANVGALSAVTDRFTSPIAVHDADDPAGPIAGPRREAAVAQATSLLSTEAMIIYTSGTTGNPKGCIISNEACLQSGEFYAGAGGIMHMEAGHERIYAPFPSFHMSISVFTLNAVTQLRNCLITRDGFHVSTWWADVVSTQATIVHYLGIVPPVLLRTPPTELEKHHRVKFGQGAGVDPSVREQFELRFGFPLVEGWGMTETARAIHNAAQPRCMEARAFGRPRLPLEVRVVDDNDATVPFGTEGELLVRAAGAEPRKGFFSGYLKQLQETEHAWRGGWFHTGDIVTQREDGMLFFVERRKNIIRRSGENISAAAIEDALVRDPAVDLVAVIAVPDELHDEEIMACVRVTAGHSAGAQLAAAILERARDKLAHYKLPGWIAFLDEIPVTGTQKIRKGVLFPEGSDPRADPRTYDLRTLKRRPPQHPQHASGGHLPTGNR
jgi:acyl-CoA synthetase (AMP-forming)/AMP-acid ligase II